MGMFSHTLHTHKQGAHKAGVKGYAEQQPARSTGNMSPRDSLQSVATQGPLPPIQPARLTGTGRGARWARSCM